MSNLEVQSGLAPARGIWVVMLRDAREHALRLEADDLPAAFNSADKIGDTTLVMALTERAHELGVDLVALVAGLR